MIRQPRSLADDLRKAHRVLMRDLRHIEEMLCAGDRVLPAELRYRLTELRAHVSEHFRFEEEDGYMEAVLEREPSLERTVRQLREEHGRLARSLETLIEEAGRTGSLDEAYREQVWSWIRDIRHHEAMENRFVQDAFNQDADAED